jgi:hypothetical protein
VSNSSAEDADPSIETTAATDCRSSIFPSHVGSYSSWESASATDINSSSSRDSNGSLQDACFAASCCNETFDINSKK